MSIEKIKRGLKRAWHFFWEEDSALSWIANIIVAFVVIKFILYPVLGFALGTSFPLVAVISESMEHGLHENNICGNYYTEFPESSDAYWVACGSWYEYRNISKEQFDTFPLNDGFNKGDVIILWRANPSNIEVGDVLVFQGSKAQPIIHRVVKVWQEDGKYYYQTKGDHNANSINGFMGETSISEDRVYGKGILRLPYLGWMKILVADLAGLFGITIA